MSLKISRILLPLLLLLPFTGASAASFEAGRHYTVIGDEASEEPTVMEFFSYGCGGCYSFEPFMARAKVALGDDVTPQFIPVDFGGGFWTPTQEIFLVLDALGRRDELHEKVFQFIHGERGGHSGRAMRKFAERHGISAEQYDKTLKSFAVHVKKQRYDQLTKRYRIGTTPTVIVNGKYRVEHGGLTTPDEFVRLVKFLLQNP